MSKYSIYTFLRIHTVLIVTDSDDSMVVENGVKHHQTNINGCLLLTETIRVTV